MIETRRLKIAVIYIIVLLQSVTIPSLRLFFAFRITKCDEAVSLKSVTGFYYKKNQVLQGMTDCG